MSYVLISVAAFFACLAVVFFPYWFSIPKWERRRIVEYWKAERQAKKLARRQA